MTAINPTPAGEGKTTTTVGLADALQRMGKKPVVALREPSLGPVFGMKGGAAGGADMHRLYRWKISTFISQEFSFDRSCEQLTGVHDRQSHLSGNDLNIDPRKIVWKRCVDMNDRQLRFVTDGLGGRVNGVPRRRSANWHLPTLERQKLLNKARASVKKNAQQAAKEYHVAHANLIGIGKQLAPDGHFYLPP